MKITFFTWFCLINLPLLSSASAIIDRNRPDPSHDLWNDLLTEHVNEKGTVDYGGIQANIAKLDAYLDLLAKNPVQSDWTRVEKLSYWINAYNAFTVKLIAEQYPVSSIMDLEGGEVWDKRAIKLGDQEYTLNDIEHTKLRKEIGDPRIHFAVNCAAVSCPPLHNEAYTPGNVDHLMSVKTKAFINNEAYNAISPEVIRVSKIFEWYSGDFDDLINFLNQYTDQTIDPDATIIYRDYNWELNG